MHDRTDKPRHLAVVPPDGSGPDVPRPRDAEPVALPRPGGRVRLTGWQRQEAEDARQLLWQLAEAGTPELAANRLAFNLGRLHGAALNLLDIIDAITEP